MAALQRDYSLNFVTSAELSGANAAAAGVKKVGDAATSSGDKLDEFEKEFKARMEGIRAKTEAMREQLRDSGRQAGQEGGAGVGEGLNLAANMHLVGQAWQIGSQIGDALSKALVIAHEDGMENLVRDAKAWLGIMEAQVEQDLERQKSTLPAMHRAVNAGVLREYRAFWDEYHDLKPETVGDWLDELARKADIATTKLRGLSAVQAAAMKIGKSQIEQDYLDEKQNIENSSDPESVKARKLAQAETKKREREAAMRAQQREDEAAGLDRDVAGKESRHDELMNKQMEQDRRAKAYTEAKAAADREIEGRERNGQQMSDLEKRDTRGMFMRNVGRNHGINDLDYDTNEAAALEKIKQQREAADKALVQARIEAEAKKHALGLDGANDQSTTAREQARADREAERKAIEARRREMEKEAEEKAKRDAYEAANKTPPPPPVIPPEGQEQAPAGDLMAQVGKAAQTTGDSGLKMALEELRRQLSDGASQEELKQLAVLMQRASQEGNGAMREVVAAVRGAIDATGQQLAAVRSEMATLRASVENLKTK